MKQNMWRKFRESRGLDTDDEEELRNKIIAMVPERKPIFDAENLDMNTTALSQENLKSHPSCESKVQLSLVSLSLAQLGKDLSQSEITEQVESELRKENCDASIVGIAKGSQENSELNKSELECRKVKSDLSQKTKVVLGDQPSVVLAQDSDPLYSVQLKLRPLVSSEKVLSEVEENRVKTSNHLIKELSLVVESEQKGLLVEGGLDVKLVNRVEKVTIKPKIKTELSPKSSEIERRVVGDLNPDSPDSPIQTAGGLREKLVTIEKVIETPKNRAKFSHNYSEIDCKIRGDLNPNNPNNPTEPEVHNEVDPEKENIAILTSAATRNTYNKKEKRPGIVQKINLSKVEWLPLTPTLTNPTQLVGDCYLSASRSRGWRYWYIKSLQAQLNQ